MAGMIDIPVGDPQAVKVFSRFVFSQVQSAPGFMKLLSSAPPRLTEDMPYIQTDTGTPVVKAMNLGKGKGDTIQFTLYNIFTGKPVMGSANMEGKMMNATSSTKTVRVDQSRGGTQIDEMSRYRTVNDLRMVGVRGLRNWGVRIEDQRCLVHLAGARGAQNFNDWCIPYQTDPDFSSIMVNTVQAPTKNRRFIAGSNGHTSVSTMTITDVLSLSDVGTIAAMVKQSSIPIMPVQYDADPYKWDKPMWVLFVSETQWELMKRPSAMVNWNAAATNAIKRFDGAERHPLFAGDGIMWNGILVKPLGRYAITFNPGDSVTEDSGGSDGGTYTETTATVPTTAASVGSGVANGSNFCVDRAILVGAQALMKAYGDVGSDSYFWQWEEEYKDFKDKLAMVVKMVEGTQKVRFRINNVDTDHGVAVIDSYAPPLNTAEYKAAMLLP